MPGHRHQTNTVVWLLIIIILLVMFTQCLTNHKTVYVQLLFFCKVYTVVYISVASHVIAIPVCLSLKLAMTIERDRVEHTII